MLGIFFYKCGGRSVKRNRKVARLPQGHDNTVIFSQEPGTVVETTQPMGKSSLFGHSSTAVLSTVDEGML